MFQAATYLLKKNKISFPPIYPPKNRTFLMVINGQSGLSPLDVINIVRFFSLGSFSFKTFQTEIERLYVDKGLMDKSTFSKPGFEAFQRNLARKRGV
jgi:hypothetical protein